jgi:hypothetical protein
MDTIYCPFHKEKMHVHTVEMKEMTDVSKASVLKEYKSYQDNNIYTLMCPRGCKLIFQPKEIYDWQGVGNDN